MKVTCHQIPISRLVEVAVDVAVDGTCRWSHVSRLDGCRVKLTVSVPEELVDTVSVDSLVERAKTLGAEHVRTPEVRVVRKDVVRDERHHVDVPLEESLRIFAEETKVSGIDRLVEFAASVAREADLDGV